MTTEPETEALTTTKPNTPQDATAAGFQSAASFDLLQRMAKMMSRSEVVPKSYQGDAGVPNCAIAIEMANRMGMNAIAVAQSLYAVNGKPSWSGQFVIAAVNATNRFTPLRFEFSGDGDERLCKAWAFEQTSGEKVYGPPVSIKMAKDEGWYGKQGSKWKTMPDLMMSYRAGTFFGRIHCPEILMGMQTAEEIEDIETRESHATEVAKRFPSLAPIFPQLNPRETEAVTVPGNSVAAEGRAVPPPLTSMYVGPWHCPRHPNAPIYSDLVKGETCTECGEAKA